MTARDASDRQREDRPGADPDEDGRRPAGDLVIITGMSGAGRSEAIHTFEDLGYFCIDNLPPSLISNVVALTELRDSRIERVAVACDVRGRQFFDELGEALGELRRAGRNYQLLFLEAEDRVLLQRFKATRRRHPLSEEGAISKGMKAEREALQPFRGMADVIIDTSLTGPRELRGIIRNEFAAGCPEESLMITVTSFGFKYGVPSDADIAIDVRFLPNPYYVARLKRLNGTNRKVAEYVLGQPDTEDFLGRWFAMLETLMPGYLREGKTHLAIALGCTGGQHRSVTLAEKTAEFLRTKGFNVTVTHRDILKDREQ